MIVYAIFVVLITGCLQSSLATWTNYEQDFAFECPDLYHVSSLQSEYGRNDRRWEIGCGRGFVGQDCQWSEDQIEGEQAGSRQIIYHCPQHWAGPDMTYVKGASDVLTGIRSRFNGGRGRIWNFKCCKINTKIGTDCRLEQGVNDEAGEPMEVVIPADRAIVWFGYYGPDQLQSDRLWWFRTCRYVVCTVTNLNILDNITATRTDQGQKIIGIAADQTCSSDLSALSLTRTDTIQKTVGLSIGEGQEYNWGVAVSVSAEVSAGFLGVGSRASFGLEVSGGGAVTAERVETEDTSVGSEDAAGKSLTYTGPGAAIIIGTVDRYRLDVDNVNVEITSTCDDGTEWRKRTTVRFSETTYGMAFFRSRRATFNPGRCDRSSEDCIDNIRGENAYDPHSVFRDFEQCIGDKGSVAR